MQAVILSAGPGMRLWPLTEELPKCLIKVRGKPLLEYQLDHLVQFGITKVVVTAQRRHERIITAEVARLQANIVLSVEDEILGTAGGLRKALELVEDDNILVMNADDLTDVNINELCSLGTPAICVTRAQSNFGVINLNGERVISFEEKPILPYYTSVGWYYLSRDIRLPNTGMLENDVFPRLANEGKLKAHYHKGFWVTINTMKDINEAEKRLG